MRFKLLIAACLAAMLTACGPSIRDTVVTSENRQEVLSKAQDSDKLSAWEKQLLYGAEVQEAFGPLGGNYRLEGKTIQQIIDDAQAREDAKNGR